MIWQIEYLIKKGPLANYARKEKDQQDDMSWDIKEKRDPPPPPNTRNTTTPTHQQVIYGNYNRIVGGFSRGGTTSLTQKQYT